jgi:hypothetical protein
MTRKRKRGLTPFLSPESVDYCCKHATKKNIFYFVFIKSDEKKGQKMALITLLISASQCGIVGLS